MCYGRGNCDGGCERDTDYDAVCVHCETDDWPRNERGICERCVELAEEADAMPFDEAWPTRPAGV